MATNSEIIDESIKEKRHRPDGTNIDRYKNLDKWSYKRWAWEFLRRNDNFIHECRRVAGGTAEDKEEVASTFGLKQFKDFRERYSSQGNRPRFSTGAISSWSNLNEENNKKSKKIKVASGQVLIRFDLMSAIADSESLTKQLKLATKRLERRVLAYSKEIGVEQKSHNHKITNFGFYLRILDALADKRPPKEMSL